MIMLVIIRRCVLYFIKTIWIKHSDMTDSLGRCHLPNQVGSFILHVEMNVDILDVARAGSPYDSYRLKVV